MPRSRTPRITVEPYADATEEQLSAYGKLYVAKVGDFTSEPRSTEQRAIGEAEAHLASLVTDDGDEA